MLKQKSERQRSYKFDYFVCTDLSESIANHHKKHQYILVMNCMIDDMYDFIFVEKVIKSHYTQITDVVYYLILRKPQHIINPL